MNASVSVIIPFYNRADWLEEAVKSALNQTYPVHEIIVINDGSNENDSDFLKTYGDSIRYIRTENRGPAIARNLGIELSTGDYIAFLDSDDVWLPQKLERQIPLMAERRVVWSHTSYETFVDGFAHDSSKTIIKSVAAFDGDIYPDMLPSCCMATPCVVVQGDVLRNDPTLRFNPEMRYGEDSYLWLNLAVRFEILAISEVLTRVRIRGNNAALRARVQLRAKAVLWTYMRENRGLYFKKRIPALVSFAYRLSVLGTAVLKEFEKVIRNERCLEYLSRFLYISPWIIFKSNAKR